MSSYIVQHSTLLINCQRSFCLKTHCPEALTLSAVNVGQRGKQVDEHAHGQWAGGSQTVITMKEKKGELELIGFKSSKGFPVPFRTALFLSVHNHQCTSARLNLYRHFPVAMQSYCLIIIIVITEGSP